MLLSLACCLCCLANSLGTKITYIIWFIAFGVVSWVLRDYGDDIFDSLPGGVDKCRPNDPQDEGLISESECVGKEAVLRMSFGTFLFFLAQAIFLLGCRSPGDPRLVLHKGLWLLKLLAWAGILTGCFYMPAKAIEVYAGFALVFACLFLLLQLVVTINYVLKANEWLVDGEEPKAVKKVVLILGSVILYSAGLVVIGWAYHFFAPRGSCSVNIFWITFTLILGLAVTVLSVSKYRISSAGLLTSAAVFAYCAYLLATALVSEPLNSCVRDELSDDSRWVMVVGFVLGLVAVMICVFSASFQSEVFELKVSDDDGDLEAGEKGLDLSLDHRPDFMHLVFALGAAYVGLVLINWNTRDIPDDDFVLDKGWVSAWIKIGTQWVCFVLYAWVLVAPKLLRNREFS